MARLSRPKGMRAFIVIWIGQFISMVGTGMTNLGIPIWVYRQTGRATDLTIIGGLFTLSLLIMSPFAGVLIDRSNRKLTMMLSDLAAGLVTLTIFILYSLGLLQIWHLYVSAVIQGAFQTFQWPAFSAAISTMVSKEQYTRTGTMMELAGHGSFILSPMLAAMLLGYLGNQRGFQLILLIDMFTAACAVSTLLLVHIPPITREGDAAQGKLLEEMVFGFRYILDRPSLLGLQLVFMTGNFFSGVAFSLFAPLILAHTDSNAQILGTLETIGAIGAVVGGVAISVWGGFKRRVHGVLVGWTLTGIFNCMLIGLGRSGSWWLGLPVWGLGRFLGGTTLPLVDGSNQAIWQAKVSPGLQGRVFTTRRMIAWLVNPLASFTAGPLADRVFGPAMMDGGSLVGTFSWLVGSGPGAGMSLLYIFAGLIVVAIGLGGYLFPAIRDTESILPDHDEDAGAIEAQGVA